MIFLLGFILGGIAGVILTTCLVAASDADDREGMV